MATSLKKQLIRQATGVGALKVVSLSLGLLSSILIARILGPTNYGLYALVTSIIALLAMPLHAGLPALLVREVARMDPEHDSGLLHGLRRRVLQWISIGSAVVIAGVLSCWLFAEQSAPGSVLWGLVMALPLIPAMALNSTRAAMLRGLKRVFVSQFPESIVQPVGHLIFLGVAVTFFHLTVGGALSSLVVSTVLGCVIGQVLLSRVLRGLQGGVQAPRYQTAQWLRSLAPFTMIAAVFVVNAQVSTVVLGVLSSREQVAFLRVADRSAQLIALVMTVGNVVVAPYIAQFAKQGDLVRLQQITTRSIRGALLVAVPVAAGLMIFGNHIVAFVFGASYGSSVWLPLIILCVGQLINVFFGPAGTILNMSGHERDALVGVALGMLTNLFVAIATAQRFGAVGGAVGVALGIMVWNAYFSYRVKIRLNVRSTPF